MAKWLNAECVFSRRGAILTITRHDAIGRDLTQLLKNNSNPDGIADPDRWEALFRGIIHTARPELSDCVLVYMEYNHSRQSWDIGIEHPSLPKVPLACELKRIPLFIPEGYSYNPETEEYRKIE